MTQWGILGTSRIASDFISAVSTPFSKNSINIAAVGARSAARAAEFAKEFGIPRSHGSYADLLADEGVQVVYIATPTLNHFEHAMMALRAGKHCLVEKPITINKAQCDELFGEAKKRSLFLMEANWMLFWPLFRKARDMVDRGDLGKVNMIQVDLGFNHDRKANPALLDLEKGGGALLAVGMYCVSLANTIFQGEPNEIAAQAVFADTGADESTSAILKYDEGRQAILTGTVGANTGCTAVILGDKGKVTLDGPMFVCPTRLTFTRFDGSPPETFISPSPEVGVNRSLFFPNSGGLIYEALHVHEQVLLGSSSSPIASPSQSFQLSSTLDAIRKAAGGPWYPGEERS